VEINKKEENDIIKLIDIASYPKNIESGDISGNRIYQL
jgi:hypothetical protein